MKWVVTLLFLLLVPALSLTYYSEDPALIDAYQGYKNSTLSLSLPQSHTNQIFLRMSAKSYPIEYALEGWRDCTESAYQSNNCSWNHTSPTFPLGYIPVRWSSALTACHTYWNPCQLGDWGYRTSDADTQAYLPVRIAGGEEREFISGNCNAMINAKRNLTRFNVTSIVKDWYTCGECSGWGKCDWCSCTGDKAYAKYYNFNNGQFTSLFSPQESIYFDKEKETNLLRPKIIVNCTLSPQYFCSQSIAELGLQIFYKSEVINPALYYKNNTIWFSNSTYSGEELVDISSQISDCFSDQNNSVNTTHYCNFSIAHEGDDVEAAKFSIIPLVKHSSTDSTSWDCSSRVKHTTSTLNTSAHTGTTLSLTLPSGYTNLIVKRDGQQLLTLEGFQIAENNFKFNANGSTYQFLYDIPDQTCPPPPPSSSGSSGGSSRSQPINQPPAQPEPEPEPEPEPIFEVDPRLASSIEKSEEVLKTLTDSGSTDNMETANRIFALKSRLQQYAIEGEPVPPHLLDQLEKYLLVRPEPVDIEVNLLASPAELPPVRIASTPVRSSLGVEVYLVIGFLLLSALGLMWKAKPL